MAKGVDYFIKPGGKMVREEALTAEDRAEFNEQVAEFVRTYGRKPTEEEEGLMRLSGRFGDIKSLVERDLVKKGTDPAIIYAFQKTGILVTRENERNISPEELQRWDEALMEYEMQKALNQIG